MKKIEDNYINFEKKKMKKVKNSQIISLTSILTFLIALFNFSTCQLSPKYIDINNSLYDIQMIFDQKHAIYSNKYGTSYLRILKVGYTSEEETLESMYMEVIYEKEIDNRFEGLLVDKSMKTAFFAIEDKLQVQNFDLKIVNGVETVIPEFTPGAKVLYSNDVVTHILCYSRNNLCFTYVYDSVLRYFKVYNPYDLDPFSFLKSITLSGPRPFRIAMHEKSDVVGTISFSPCYLKLYDMTKSGTDAYFKSKYLNGAGNSMFNIGYLPQFIATRFGRDIHKFDF